MAGPKEAEICFVPLPPFVDSAQHFPQCAADAVGHGQPPPEGAKTHAGLPSFPACCQAANEGRHPRRTDCRICKSPCSKMINY